MDSAASIAELPQPKAAKPDLEFLWLELTNRCNLQCTHCYSESTPYSGTQDLLTEDEYKALLSDARTLGCRQVQFIGGEPTLNKNLPQLIRFASHLAYEFIEVFTNLLTLEGALITTLQECGTCIATSFYSSRRPVHDQITRGIGSFDKTVANIRRVLSAGIPLRVGVIEMPANAGEFERTTAFLRTLGVTSIGLDHVRAFGRAQPGNSCSMSDLCGKCAGNILAVGPDGVVAPCIMSKRWALGSALTDRLTNIVRSDRTAAIRNEIASATGANMTDCYPQCGPQSPSCTPECNPSAQCVPCAPNGGHKCQPNGWCGPAQ